MLSALGSVGGLALAVWGSRAIVAALTTRTNGVVLDIAPDWRVFAFTTAVGVATGLLFGVIPALRASREGIDSFYSDKDWISCCLLLTGTADGWGCSSAGRRGFEPGKCAEYARLRQYPWNDSMGDAGHTGGHYGCTRLEFFRAYVVPLLVCGEDRPAPVAPRAPWHPGPLR